MITTYLTGVVVVFLACLLWAWDSNDLSWGAAGTALFLGVFWPAGAAFAALYVLFWTLYWTILLLFAALIWCGEVLCWITDGLLSLCD